MSETDLVQIGDQMPRLASVVFHDGYEVAVSWQAGARQGKADVVDLAPMVLAYKIYRPLRDNPNLLRSVHLQEGGAAIGWGEGDEVDLAATTVERLAEEAMSPSEFCDWLERHAFTFDAAAAQLGISRRLVAYYAASRRVPRYMALACRYIDLERGPHSAPADRAPAEKASLGHRRERPLTASSA